MIVILNIISFTILITTTGLILRGVTKNSNKSVLALLLAFALLSISEFTNILEHMEWAPETDEWEDLLEIVFFPLLILSMHINMLEEELNKRLISDNKFEAIFNNASTFIGLLDNQGRLLEANEAASKASKIDPKSLVGQYFWETPWWIHSPEEQEKIKEAVVSARHGQTTRFRTNHLNVDGQLIYIDFSLTPVFNYKNETVFLIPEGRNITELTLALQELEKHKNFLEDLVLEKTKELNTALHISKQLNEKLFKANQEQEQRNLELKRQSEYLKLTLDQLQATQNQLIESEKMASLGILTAGVAHEINNPLNFIMGGITSIDRYTDEHLSSQHEEIKAHVKTIYSGIGRIIKIVKSLNSYSRTDNYQISRCDINSILEDCLVMLQNKWKGLIQVSKEYTEQAYIEANEGRIHQVFLNLLNNAIQAIDNSGEITISTKINNEKLTIEISDTGVGIAPENIKRIFDPFFTTKEPNEGTGLGLSITQKIISDYNGTIRYISEKEQGTTVQVVFPLLHPVNFE